MSLLKEYIREYIKRSEPNSRVYVYLDVTDDTISEYKTNLIHVSNYCRARSRHVFIKPMKINVPNRYIYDTFMNPKDLVRVLSADVIPHTHSTFIIYVIEDALHLDHPIGDEFVLISTIVECNRLLSTVCHDVNQWLNSAYHRDCVIGPLTEHRLVGLLASDRSLPDRHIDSYLEGFVLAMTLSTMLSGRMEEAPDSVLRILQLFDGSLPVSIPPTMRYGDSGLITTAVLNFVMNLDKVRYSIGALDDILGVRISPSTLKSHFVHEIGGLTGGSAGVLDVTQGYPYTDPRLPRRGP